MTDLKFSKFTKACNYFIFYVENKCLFLLAYQKLGKAKEAHSENTGRYFIYPGPQLNYFWLMILEGSGHFRN